jgi:hypothetical protein
MLNLLVGGRSGSAEFDAGCATVVLIKAAMTTRVRCSAVDAASWDSAPNRRCGSRGVRGPSGSR